MESLKRPRAESRHIRAMLTKATVADLTEGLDWYERASRFARKLAETYDVDYLVACGVIAAISPNVKWSQNMRSAESMINAHYHGINPMSIKVCGYPIMRSKAADILALGMTGPELNLRVLEILNGPKISSFYRCISGDQQEVCVDGHALSVFVGERIPLKKTPSISPTLYATVQRAYTRVSEVSLALCGHSLTPAQVQAVTWVAYRRIHNIK